MLMQRLTSEERKAYKHGDFILYDDRPTDEQQQIKIERANEWGYTVNTCAFCGRITEGGKTYCSQRCRNDAYMERRRQRHLADLAKTCSVCGKPFTAKRVDAQYCSPACKQSAYRSRVTDSRSGKISGYR